MDITKPAIEDFQSIAMMPVEVGFIPQGEVIAREFQAVDDICKRRKLPSRPAPFNPLKDYCPSVLPFPSSRAETLCGSYINASVVTGISGLSFIASQGPLDSTVKDFWSMVARHRVTTIVSLCGAEECADYMPGPGMCLNFLGGLLRVRSVSEEAASAADGLRWSSLEISYKEESWHLERLHCQAWQDAGAMHADSLVHLAERTIAASERGTTVVHCRAGVGRTGCLIAVCDLLASLAAQAQQAASAPPRVSVPHAVSNLRLYRPHMVMTSQQYESIYAAIDTWYAHRRNRAVTLSSSTSEDEKET